MKAGDVSLIISLSISEKSEKIRNSSKTCFITRKNLTGRRKSRDRSCMLRILQAMPSIRRTSGISRSKDRKPLIIGASGHSSFIQLSNSGVYMYFLSGRSFFTSIAPQIILFRSRHPGSSDLVISRLSMYSAAPAGSSVPPPHSGSRLRLR